MNILIPQLLETFKEIMKRGQEISKEISEQLGVDEKKDVRFLFFKSLGETLQTYYLTQDLISKIPELEFVEKGLAGREGEEKEVFLNELSKAYSNEMRDALFIGFFVDLEMSLKILLRECFGITGKNDFDLQMESAIDMEGINQEYKNLIKVLIYVRNTIHFGGIRTYHTDTTIIYKDRKYAFIKDKPTEGTDFAGVLFLIAETQELFKSLVFSEPVKKVNLILHPHVEFFS